MEKLIRIVGSPFNSNLEVVGDLTIKLHVPYSEEDVTIEVNPNIQDYKENHDQPGVQVREMMVTTNTEQTKTLKFDFKESNFHKIEIDGKTYEIKLMLIGKEKMEGQDFPSFEFFVKCEDK